MGWMRTIVAGAVTATVLLAGCTSEEPPKEQASAAQLGRSTVTGPDGWAGTVAVAAPKVTEPLVEDTQSLLEAGFMVGMPLELSTKEPLPAGGVTISRTYPAPLGADMAATLAFFDAGAGAWKAVPSTLSADRRTVSATVTHLSTWTDVVAGTKTSLSAFTTAAGSAVHAGAEFTGQAMAAAGRTLADVADWMYYAVGKVFDTRVDAPSCEKLRPYWVADVTFIEDNRTNPIRFCAGRDAKHPDQLVLKARVNRGFAYAAKPKVKTAWRYNSTDKDGLWDALLPWLQAYDAAFRDVLLQATGGDPRWSVGAGQELSIGVTESAVRGAKASTMLELQPPDALGFLYSLLGQLLAQDGANKDVSAVSAAFAVTSCITSVAEADRDDPLTIARAVLTCLQSQSDTVAKLVVKAMVETGQDAVKTVNVAGLIARISIYLALVGPVFSAMNWVAESQTIASARTVDVNAKARPKTEVVTVDIYDSAGQVRSKYNVTPDSRDPVICSTVSPSATGPAVFECGSVADYLPACWKALDSSSTVLCLQEPWSSTVHRVEVLGSEASETGEPPVPFGVELVDGSRWLLRLGGAWGNYGKGATAWYGPAKSPGSDTSVLVKRESEPLFKKEGRTWSVLRGPDVGSNFDAPDKARRVDVAKVWFVSGRWQ